MKRFFVLLATLVTGLLWAGTAGAAPGDYIASVQFSEDCASGIGVGIAYDGGGHLWVSCYASNPDLLRASATTGVVDQTYNIANGLGSLAYDATRNGLWAGWGNGSSDVRFIQLDGSKSVVSSTVAFSDSADVVCGLDDGMGFDATDDSLYISDDCSSFITQRTTTGGFIRRFAWHGAGCYNSGVAIGGGLLFEGSDGCAHVWVVDKNTFAPAFDFSTIVPGDANFRDEGLTCDTETFAPTQVMWSKEAYSPNRAAAFEIPENTCGVGGQPAGKEADLSVTKTGPAFAQSGGAITYQITVGNAGPDDAANVTVDDPLPSGETLVSATPSQGSCTDNVTCDLGAISNGGSATITIVATVTAECGSTLTNTSTVSSDQDDPNPDNNSSSTSAFIFCVVAGGGNFVIGDQEAAIGTAVTFWGAQWWKLNPMSGGSGPASFKGFETTPAVAACGTNWTTGPGNSPPPPAGPLPAYMAVIVSSSISQSGSTISGNTPHIVIVKTNPGYDANPGHAGTGTVYAQVC